MCVCVCVYAVDVHVSMCGKHVYVSVCRSVGPLVCVSVGRPEINIMYLSQLFSTLFIYLFISLSSYLYTVYCLFIIECMQITHEFRS